MARRCVPSRTNELSHYQISLTILSRSQIRWTETVKVLNVALKNVVGDILVSAGTVSYLGPFTSDFRADIVSGWRDKMAEDGVPHTRGCDIVSTLAIPVELRSWQLAGLPTDELSTQNGIIMDKSRRWPLFIDPQSQANKYIKNLGKDKELCMNGMDVIKLSEKNYLRGLINGVRFGKWVLLENIKEELDASLEPILLQQTFKQGGTEMMKIGDDTIPYSDMFKFFITTKMPNPHYAPEVQVKVSLLNFTITPVGLEEQLLDVVVKEEMPELAEKRVALMIENAAMDKQMYDIETQILQLLENSEGNILDDTVLIDTLAEAKVTSNTIAQKMEEAKIAESEITATSEEYRPVAFRSAQVRGERSEREIGCVSLTLLRFSFLSPALLLHRRLRDHRRHVPVQSPVVHGFLREVHRQHPERPRHAPAAGEPQRVLHLRAVPEHLPLPLRGAQDAVLVPAHHQDHAGGQQGRRAGVEVLDLGHGHSRKGHH